MDIYIYKKRIRNENHHKCNGFSANSNILTKERAAIMKVTICLGSSCHLKGARRVVERLQYLVNSNNLKDKVDLEGSFCLGMCQEGVNVTIDGTVFSVMPDSVDSFFETEILPRLDK